MIASDLSHHISPYQYPIGIFDSGIGGLTVAKAVAQLLPNEDIIYFGDTAHLPYGDKSTAAIQAYSIKICDVLLEHQCKVILIACNSASAAAFDLVKEYVGSRAWVCNVIDPVVQYVQKHHQGQTIGLIGTKKTIHSGVYAEKIKEAAVNIDLRSLATPLLVPMIEEGFFNHNISQQVIHTYLQESVFEGIQALILGCTHFPLIAQDIATYFQEKFHEKVDILDTAHIVAQYVADHLQNMGLLQESHISEKKFFVSDYTHSFERSTKIFFGEQVQLIHYKLWE